MQPLILFIHIPKTAGTSFRTGLADAFGVDAVLLDYGADAAATDSILLEWYRRVLFEAKEVAEIVKSRHIAALCGHFPLEKYQAVFPEANRVTFIREPLQRCYSEYLHWQRHKGYSRSFADFFRQEEMVNIQSRLLNGMPESGIVGITEDYATSLRIINQELGLAVASFRENCSRERTTLQYDAELIPPDLAGEFYQLNQEDLEFYQEQVEIFGVRKAKLKLWDRSLLPRAVRKSRQALAGLVGRLS